MSFVLDASMTLAWHFADEHSSAADAIGERASRHGVVVPSHWFAEVANSLRTGERRRRTSPEAVAPFLARLDMLEIDVDPASAELAFGRALPLARAHGLTVYDALYLELAERTGLPLATLDGDLGGAATAAGIEVLGGTP